MGFGQKTDYSTGRVLDLDKSYEQLIKPAVLAAGLECIRGDEILHSGSIDTPLYRELVQADVVIADLSTGNLNTFYQLGIRHALRPKTTFIIAESELRYPFDLHHATVYRYTHGGSNIDVTEVDRFRSFLQQALIRLLDSDVPDSPVYTFLNDLIPPQITDQSKYVAVNQNEPEKPGAGKETEVTLAALLKIGQELAANKQYAEARKCYEQAATMSNNPFIIQRVVYCMYKAKLPDEQTALLEARILLQELSPQHSIDSGVLKLLGDIELRLFHITTDADRLIRSREAYEKLYIIQPAYHEGITLAFIISQQAVFETDRAEKLAAIVTAARLKQQVIDLCKAKLNEISLIQSLEGNTGVQHFNPEEKLLALSILAECYYALNMKTKYASVINELMLEKRAFNRSKFEQQVRRWDAFKDHPALLAGVNDLVSHSEHPAQQNNTKPGRPEKKDIPTPPATGNKQKKIFISYAHDDNDNGMVDLFEKELKSHLKAIEEDYVFTVFKDDQILLGEDWNERLIKEAKGAEIAILLLSSSFLQSEYIKKWELATFLENNNKDANVLLCPIYFDPFQFKNYHILKQFQFFKPEGKNYGPEYAYLEDDLCYTDLVKFNMQTGLPLPNRNRSRYMIDLVEKVEKALKE